MAFPLPDHPDVRHARLSDLPRIALVAAASFFHSSFFPFTRPFYSKYPGDTVASYCAEYRECILNPKKVVLVALHDYKKNEADDVDDALKGIYSQHRSESYLDEDGKIIVGIISMSLERHEALMLESDREDRRRDTFPGALKMVEVAFKEAESKYIRGPVWKTPAHQSTDIYQDIWRSFL
jgi:hypothetical protein